MIAAIVVPAGARSIVMIRACLVSGRIAAFEDEGANRVRDLGLLVERAAAWGFDLGLVMESSVVRATAIRRTTSAPPSKPPGGA